MNWTIPLSANLVLRNLGLTLFLAQVGMSSGPKFAATVAETGFLFLGYWAPSSLVALVLPILVLGLYVFRMPFDQVAGIVAGAVRQPGDPRLLEQARADRPAGHRLRDDLSRHDDREDPLRGHRPRLLQIGRRSGMTVEILARAEGQEALVVGIGVRWRVPPTMLPDFILLAAAYHGGRSGIESPGSRRRFH